MPDIVDRLDSNAVREFAGSELEAALDPDTGKWEVIAKYYGDISSVENALEADVEYLNTRYAIITLPQKRIAELYEYPGIEYIELPKRLYKNMQESHPSICLPLYGVSSGYDLTGSGVLVAIIDSGIDYHHPDFISADGTSRILYLWDQGAQGTPPPSFKSGAEYGNTELSDAVRAGRGNQIVPHTDAAGHGTAVSGIAAGNGRASRGEEAGVAPGASLLVVALGRRGQRSFARTTELMRGIKYAYTKAAELGMPLVINLSYGTNDGSHDGTTLFETFIDDMAQQGKSVIVAASGNEGAAGHHFFAQLKQSESVHVEFSTAPNIKSMYIVMWKNFADTFSIELISPGGMSSGIISPLRSNTFHHLDNTAVYISYGQPTHYNKSQEIYIQLSGGESQVPVGLWKLVVIGEQVVDGRFDVWLPTLEEVTNATAFLRPSTETTLTIPSTASEVISVGGYNARLNSTAAFSGRGYTRSNVYVKPDLAAPAVNIITTGVGGGYSSFTGTSMAAPFVTGASALMMEWGIVQGRDPFLYGQRVKAFLRAGASREQSNTYPNPIWGYGRLCIRSTLELLVRYNP